MNQLWGLIFRRDEGAAYCFHFPVFLFGRHTAPYGSSQDLYGILIIMHQKMRLKIIRAMALSLGYLQRVVFTLIAVFS